MTGVRNRDPEGVYNEMAKDIDLIAAMADAHLTPFEGKDVVRATMALVGAGDGLSKSMAVDPMEIPEGAEVTIVIRGVVDEIAYKKIGKDTPNLLGRKHKIIAGTAMFIDNDVVSKALDEQDAKIRVAKEKAHGIESLKAEDGNDPVAEAEKADKAAKRAAKAAAKADQGAVVQSGEFKSEPFDATKEAARARRPRTPAAAKGSVDEAVEAAKKLAEKTAKGADVVNIDDARKAAGSDG